MTGRTDTDGTDVQESAAARLAAAREEYAQLARRGRAGRDAASRYSYQMDGVVQSIVAGARDRTSTPFVVCAVGGYGRRALCLHSDVDLLIVFDGTIGAPEERFVNAVLQPLWDLRLELGQHVREIAEFADPDPTNPEFLLSLFDLRYLAGDETLYDCVANRAAAHIPTMIEPLLTLVSERHAQFNNTLYQLEPDIKQAPGGLRDSAVIAHLRAMAPEVFVSGRDVDLNRVAGAEDFLLRVRSILHVLGGRDVNLLTHELQEKVAEMMGCAGSHPHQRVEALMGEYFLRARAVTRALTSTKRALRPRPDVALRRIGKHFEITADGVQFANVERAKQQPSLWLEAFRIALEHQCAVSDAALALIEQHAHRCSADDFVATEGDRLQLRRILTPRAGLYERLSEMHDCGLLNRIFPRVRQGALPGRSRLLPQVHGRRAYAACHSQRGVAPRTGERDSPQVTRVLSSTSFDAGAADARAAVSRRREMAREPTMRVESVRHRAKRSLDRLALPDAERETVLFLIREHLRMSQVAFRRDTEDPEIVRPSSPPWSETEERLKLLCLMTLADVGAVQPRHADAVEGRVPVARLRRRLQPPDAGTATSCIERSQRPVGRSPAGRSGDIATRSSSRFSGRAAAPVPAPLDSARSTVTCVSRATSRPDEVHSFLENHDGGLGADAWSRSTSRCCFRNICGVLSSFGMDILRGHALTSLTGSCSTSSGSPMRGLPGAELAAPPSVSTARSGRRGRVARRAPRCSNRPGAQPPARRWCAARR